MVSTTVPHTVQFGKDGIKVSRQDVLTILHPPLHVGSSLVDIVLGYPVLSTFAHELEVGYGDLVTSNKLPVFEEVCFDDVQRISEFVSGYPALDLIAGLLVLHWHNALPREKKKKKNQ